MGSQAAERAESKTLVLKFGGTSVGSPERIRKVARIVAAHRKLSSRVVVAVSAMGDTTDELISLATRVSPDAEKPRHRREMDMLLSSGERISMALLSMALGDVGVEALSLTGSQSGIITDTVHGEARIAEVRPVRIRESLDAGKVVIVAGFQGVSRSKEITTLGRGGTDTTAVALGVALGANEVVIYTDVDGFYSADPRRVPQAKRLEQTGWDLAVEAAGRGAQVLHPRCVELAWKFSLPVRVCTSFVSDEDISAGKLPVGTIVKGCFSVDSSVSFNLEGPRVMTVALQGDLSEVVVKTKDIGEGASVYKKLTEKGFRAASWSQTSTAIEILVEPTQAVFLENLNVLSKRAGLARLSLIGSGLGAATEIQSRLQEIAADLSLKIVALKVSPTALELVIEANKSEALTLLLQRAHQEFVLP